MTLRLLGHIELPAHRSNGGFDHADIHSPTDRIYVAHTANDSIDVIDCAQDRYVESIPGFTAVAGALVSKARGLVFTTNRGENTISVFTPGGERRDTEARRVAANIAKLPVLMDQNKKHSPKHVARGFVECLP